MIPDATSISRTRRDDLIPGYRLEKLVGQGGMGEVHKATQLSLSRIVAVKLLSSELAKDPAFVARFEKEAAALAALRHPNIVSIVDKGRSGETYYLVMEYVEGPSLREVMRHPQLEPQIALKYAFEICRAIDYAHSRGVIHRDLKPENILFDAQAGDIPKVSDFGLASFLETAESGQAKFNVTETHVAMGTASYMAPEQRVDAKGADERADVYSLGVILYELCTGELPLGTFAPASVQRPDLDRRLDTIIDQCLRPNPADRYQKVGELLEALEPLVPITASLPPRKLTPAARLLATVRRTLRTGVRMAGGVLVAVAAILILSAILRSRKPVDAALPGAEMAAQFPALTPIPAAARLDLAPARRTLSLGAGPDTVPVIPFGRPVRIESGALVFDNPSDDDHAVGRARPDTSEVEPVKLNLSAEVTAEAPPHGFWASVKSLLVGDPQDAKAALLLTGDPGRYVAVVVSGSGKPVSFEWGLAERRGAMVGPPSAPSSLVTLSVDQTGELRAFIGKGHDRRQIGEPVSLGKGWYGHFGQTMTQAQVACANGACRFASLKWEVDQDVPPPPSPEPVEIPKVSKAVEKPKPAPKPAPVSRSSSIRTVSTIRSETVKHETKTAIVKKKK